MCFGGDSAWELGDPGSCVTWAQGQGGGPAGGPSHPGFDLVTPSAEPGRGREQRSDECVRGL